MPTPLPQRSWVFLCTTWSVPHSISMPRATRTTTRLPGTPALEFCGHPRFVRRDRQRPGNRGVQPDGSTLSILSSSAPLRNQEGVITGALLVFQDITAQKRLEHEKNAFLSLASHELRTPITAIMGFAEILQLSAEQEQRLNPASQRALLAQIVAQSDHLTRLIEEMFDLTRLENAQLSLHCDWHDLLAMLNEVIASQNITAHGQSIQLVVQGCAATEPVRGYFDEQRIRQIMNNLISN